VHTVRSYRAHSKSVACKPADIFDGMASGEQFSSGAQILLDLCEMLLLSRCSTTARRRMPLQATPSPVHLI